MSDIPVEQSQVPDQAPGGEAAPAAETVGAASTTPQEPETQAAPAETSPAPQADSHPFEVAQVVGTHSNAAGISGMVVKMKSAAEDPKVDGFVLTVAHEVADLFEEGAQYVLTKVK